MVPSGASPVVPVVAANDDDAGALTDAGAEQPDAPWTGPWIGARVLTAPIYAAMYRSKDQLIGYMRQGDKAAGSDKPIQKSNCKEGWYQLQPRGYICGKHGTPDLNDARFRAGNTPPDLETVVPYKYAHNAYNGTPLYRSIPTREQQEEYEPHLRRARQSKKEKAEGREPASKHRPSSADAAVGDASAPPAASRAEGNAARDGGTRDAPRASDAPDAGPFRIGALDASAGEVDGGEEEETRPWWQEHPDGGSRDITLQDMVEGADDVLAKRMARGFFIAVDRSFRKNGRYWYRTTEGLIAPSDRMSINAPPKFEGVELGGPDQPTLPLAFIRVPKASKYEMGDDDKLERKGTVKRFEMVALTGKVTKRGETEYRETKDGWWVKTSQVNLTAPGAPPSGLGPNERWIDVNVSQQTLVAFEGTKPVYATLVSSGKKGRTKESDHSTVLGSFRIREKHVTATMDGDGAAPGEGPYSIQDVPYVIYFKGSYAIHGAFWHNNFGIRMSHGCVNLAPLDAKHIFFWSAPSVPTGWHGVWASREQPGSLVVVHD